MNNSKEWEADLLKNALLHFPFLLSRFWSPFFKF